MEFNSSLGSTIVLLDIDKSTRKQYYTINALVMSNDEYAYFVDGRNPGSAHYSRVRNSSASKIFVEGLPKQKTVLIQYPTS